MTSSRVYSGQVNCSLEGEGIKSIKYFLFKINTSYAVNAWLSKCGTVAETMRADYLIVDTLLATENIFFLKAPSHTTLFKETYSDLALPPESKITRWGTWLLAAQYYCEQLKKKKKIISKLDSETIMAIRKAQNIIQNETLKNDLIFISVSFSFVAHTITTLETKNMSINDSMQIVE